MGVQSTADITIFENTTTPGAYAGDDFTKVVLIMLLAYIGVTDEADNYSTWSSGDDGGQVLMLGVFQLLEPQVTI